jgi:O-acetyl-ADP-ribose deacetylase (regulator of RNase III)
MIEYKSGDILQEDVEALVNTVNCVGIMGRGVALQFKKAFPENFKAYAKACKNDVVQPGRMFVFETGQLINPRFIVNFPTKRHWRGQSRMEDVEAGLVDLVEIIRKYDIHSIAIPPLGCGLGGLYWKEVRQRIEAALEALNNVLVVIFNPHEAPTTVKKKMAVQKTPAMTAGRAALVELVACYLNGLLDPFVTLIEVHKLMYFMQEAGEPLRLKYVQGPYGPYAENLRHVMNAIEGYLISGYADGGDTLYKQLKLVPAASQDAQNFLQEYPDTLTRLTKVAELVEGFESPFGLELLATVHWMIAHMKITHKNEIISHVSAWDKQKQKFTPRQIIFARDVLFEKKWVCT